MPKVGQQRLVENIAGSLSQVSKEDIIERSLSYFRRADAEFGRRLTDAITARRTKTRR
jgi:catalase